MRCQHCDRILSDQLILEYAAYLKKEARKERKRLKKKIRVAARKFKKPKFTCEYCRRRAPSPEIHHVNGITVRCVNGRMRSDPEDNALWNLVELCQTCHNAVGRGAIRIKGTLPLIFDPPGS